MNATILMVTYSSRNRESADQFASLIKEQIEHQSAFYIHDEKSLELDGGGTHEYIETAIHLVVETQFLSDILTRINHLLFNIVDPKYNELYENVFQSHTVSVLMKDIVDPVEVNEFTYHLFQRAHETEKRVNNLEHSVVALQAVNSKLNKKLDSLDQSLAGLITYIYSGIKLKELSQIVMKTAARVDHTLLEEYDIVTYQ